MKTQKILSLILIILFFFLGINNIYSQDFWESANGPYGGEITALTSNSNGYIFAGTEGAIYRSNDNGENWTYCNTGLSNNLFRNRVNDLVTNSDGHIFAGTEDGVFRSTDNGENWIKVTEDVIFVTSIAINSDGHIFVGTDNGVGGAFRSTDNGDSWNQINTGLTNLFIYTLLINFDNHIIAGTRYGNFRSEDNGENWSEISSPENFGPLSSLIISSNGRIYGGQCGSGIVRSEDNGDSWVIVNNGLENTAIHDLEINSNDIIFVSTWEGVFRSTDNGDSWSEINNGLTANYGSTFAVQALTINSSDQIFAGSANYGVFRSINNGDNWIRVNKGITALTVSTINFNSSGDVFAGTDQGVFRLKNNENELIEINNGLLIDDNYNPPHRISALAINSSDHIFVGGANPFWLGYGSLFRSVDNGESWVKIRNGLPWDNPSSIVFNSNDHIFIGIRFKGVYRSTDNGENWTQINDGLTHNKITSLAINSNEDIFTGTEGGGVFRSTDNGDNWVEVNNGELEAWSDVFSLAICPDGNIFAGVAFDGIYRSTDNGDNWTRVFILNEWGEDFIPIAINSEGDIFISAAKEGIGVCRSSDNGDSWEEVNTGLTEKYVQSLAFNSNGQLFAGTHGGGVFRSKESTIAVEKATAEKPSSFSLGQNYPNPFNPTTTIQFSLPHTSFVTLKVFNILGEEVSTLVAEKLAGGKYNVEWNGSSFVSGVYYYRLETEQFVETKKLILLK